MEVSRTKCNTWRSTNKHRNKDSNQTLTRRDLSLSFETAGRTRGNKKWCCDDILEIEEIDRI